MLVPLSPFEAWQASVRQRKLARIRHIEDGFHPIRRGLNTLHQIALKIDYDAAESKKFAKHQARPGRTVKRSRAAACRTHSLMLQACGVGGSGEHAWASVDAEPSAVM